MTDEAIDAEVMHHEPIMAVAVRQEQPVGLFGTSEPAMVLQKAAAIADVLKSVIVKQGLVSNISGKQYPRVEAWTLLGTMLGVFPVTVWTKQVEGGWEARVEARTKDGSIVGAAEAQCLNTEKNWSNRDDFALRSMAQTRATAKCLRMPLGFVMTLSGFEATPAEEMTFEQAKPEPRSSQNAPGRVVTPRPISEHPPEAKTPPPAKSSPPPAVKGSSATPAYRLRMIQRLNAMPGEPCRDLVTQYLRAAAMLMPNESIEDLDLSWVPINETEMKELGARLAEFERGDPAMKPYLAHDAKPLPKLEVPRGSAGDGSDASAVHEPWYQFIVPVPRKGQKRDAYLQSPDTIGSLFDARHGTDEDAAEARRRLFGFVNNYEAKGWQKSNGQQMPPSQTDVQFRSMLDMFADWFAKNHPDEKL